MTSMDKEGFAHQSGCGVAVCAAVRIGRASRDGADGWPACLRSNGDHPAQNHGF